MNGTYAAPASQMREKESYRDHGGDTEKSDGLHNQLAFARKNLGLLNETLSEIIQEINGPKDLKDAGCGHASVERGIVGSVDGISALVEKCIVLAQQIKTTL